MKSSLIKLYRAHTFSDFDFIRNVRNYFVNQEINVIDKKISKKEQNLWLSNLDHEKNIYFLVKDLI